MTTLGELIPNRVKLVFAEPKIGWFDHLVCRSRWSPFEAACAIFGLIPSDFAPGMREAQATWPVDRRRQDWPPEHFENDVDYGEEVRELTKTIALYAVESKSNSVEPVEVVQWAIMKGLLGRHSDLVRKLDLPQPKLSLLIRRVAQGDGEISQRKRKLFKEIPPEILAKVESMIADEFGEYLDSQPRGD